jgi:hypothetical protein
MKTRQIKSVSFALDDNYEAELFEFASKNKHFSTYIKRLIQRDMERGQRVPQHIQTLPVEPTKVAEPETKEIKKDALASFGISF